MTFDEACRVAAKESQRSFVQSVKVIAGVKPETFRVLCETLDGSYVLTGAKR